MYFFLCIALLFAACNGQEDPNKEDRKKICKTDNGFYRVNGSCDAYLECVDYRPFRRLCPDGLNFNARAIWPDFPCSYPADVSCRGRGTSQPPQPNAACPRQHGFFPSPLAAGNDCSQYRLCANGRHFDLHCPYGLAFNFARARCDWPERVPGCKSADFLGFTCPAPEYDENGNARVQNFRYRGACDMFFSCQSGHARLLTCDDGYAFDVNLGHCMERKYVNCSYISDSVEVIEDKIEA